MFYTLTTIFLAVVLTLSLRKLRIEQQRIFGDVLGDERLMSAHTITFVAAAALNLVACILLKLQENTDSAETDAKLKISSSALHIINLVVLSIS